ncbi:hypothetical protein M413DRAFT_81238 [Hebeloma cylindrosporum]|uniref:Uncharacterized protein n=1 Tax=Hebeloma cylindrosporum TaxID=76867 RepID=A0A0C2Z5V0_HEBCY|nr:hypothetical protein M413DRAFT_81238 [Hebeloma cylindrosporum h7]
MRCNHGIGCQTLHRVSPTSFTNNTNNGRLSSQLFPPHHHRDHHNLIPSHDHSLSESALSRFACVQNGHTRLLVGQTESDSKKQRQRGSVQRHLMSTTRKPNLCIKKPHSQTTRVESPPPISCLPYLPFRIGIRS